MKCTSRVQKFFGPLRATSKFESTELSHAVRSRMRIQKVLGVRLKNVVVKTTWSLEFLHRARYALVPSAQGVNGVHGMHSLHTRSVQTSLNISSKCRVKKRNSMHILLLYLLISSPFSKTSATPLNAFQVSIDPVQPTTIKHNTALLEQRIA